MTTLRERIESLRLDHDYAIYGGHIESGAAERINATVDDLLAWLDSGVLVSVELLERAEGGLRAHAMQTRSRLSAKTADELQDCLDAAKEK